MTRNIADALQLIENMAESSSEKCPEYDRGKRVASVEAQQIADLSAKIDMLLKANQRGVNSCDQEGGLVSSQDNLAAGNDDEEECNYVTGHGYRQEYNPNYKHPNLSYRSTNVENPQDQVYPPTNNVGSNNVFMSFQGKSAFQSQGYQKQPYNNYQAHAPSAPPYQAPANNSQDELKTMIQMILANQQKASGEINAKLESQNAKVDGMYNNLNTKFEALSNHVKKLDTQVAQTAEAVKRSQGTLLGKPETNPQVAHIHAISLNTDVVHDLVGSTEDAEHLVAATNLPITAAPPTPVRVYTPRVPYPRPRPKTSEEICIRYEQMFEKLKVEFPSKEVQALPVLMRCIDRRAASHCSIENGVRLVAEEVNAVLKKKLPKAGKESVPAPQPKFLPKVEDPGKFVVPCSIAGVEFEGSLCDSGSCVNLMSKAIAERLGITKLEPPKMTLSFANSSTSTPCGTVLNLHVKIGDCMVCADFQVMEMPKGAKTPLILGRPFMASVGALLDMPKKRISFTLIDKNVFYETVQIAGTHQLASSISIVDTATTLGEKRNIMAINPQIPTTKSIPTEKVKRVEQKRASKLFAKISIVIPPHLRDKGDESIKELLQGTMSLFPNVRSWQVKDGVLAAVEKPQRAERAVSIRLPHDSGDPHLLGDPSRA